MGMRFKGSKPKEKPIAVTTRVGPDAGWSIRTWTGQIAPPAVEPDTPADDENPEG